MSLISLNCPIYIYIYIFRRERKMGSITEATATRPHVVCVPQPHNSSTIKAFTSLLYTQRTTTNACLGPEAPTPLRDCQTFTSKSFLMVPPSGADVSQDVASLCDSTSKNFLVPFCNFLYKLNDTSSSNVPPVTCIVADGVMSFTLDPADKFGIPCVLFWTPSACGFLNYIRHLVERGLTPLKLSKVSSNRYVC